MFKNLFEKPFTTKSAEQGPPPSLPGVIANDDAFYAKFGFTFHPEERRRQAWITARLWHNGPHANCCKTCVQAGYVLALARANRLDLITEFPELDRIRDELDRSGLLKSLMLRR